MLACLLPVFVWIERISRSSYCRVQLYEAMDSYGILVTNEFDCPLLSLTTLFRCIPSHSVMQTVSIVH